LQALISLSDMYDKQRANRAPMDSEVEFRAYHLLTLIGTHGRYGYNAAEYQNALSVSLNSLPHSSLPQSPLFTLP